MVFNEKPESELTPKELRERVAQTALAANKVSIEAVYAWIAGTEETMRLYALARRSGRPGSQSWRPVWEDDDKLETKTIAFPPSFWR